MRILMPPASTSEEQRMRLSRESAERHTSQRQPICGTPDEVPVPRKVIVPPPVVIPLP